MSGSVPATQHVPQHLAEKILNSRSAIEGERKLVTILFADLKGSMEIIADRDPEEAQRILDPLVNRMTEAVHHFEGTVSLLLGDGLMAIFGAPVAHEDHAVRACYAALRIQESVAKFADELRQSVGAEATVRVGLNSGDVVVRSVGTDLKMDYSAIGHTAHLASRMEQMAEAGSIMMAPSTRRLVEGYVTFRSVGEREVKGLSRPIEVFEVLGVSAVRSRLSASVARGLTSFLGRDTEMGILKQSLDLASEGSGQAVAVAGEAGIGKSRLIWEFTHSDDIGACRVLEGRTSAYGTSLSYAPVVDLLQSYFSVEKMDLAGDVRTRVDGVLAELGPALEPFREMFHALLNVLEDQSAWAARDPSARRRLIVDGLRTLILVESRHQPLVLIFDDLHWVDAETQTLLDALVESLPMGRVLLLCGYRPGYEHNWANRSYFREIRIAPLAQSSTEQLLDTLLGRTSTLAPLKQLLIERTDGNPLFIEESIRTLVDMKFIAGSPGTYRLLKAADSINIPESARAILSARIDRLEEDDKWILQAASVIGKEVPFTLLLAICGLREEELRNALGRLQEQEFLYETNLFPELEYTFRHALVQEVAYSSLLSNRRRALHSMIVERAEADVDKAPTLERLDHLAHHTMAGELWEKAVAYGRQAGKRAIAETALRAAASYFRGALEALGQIPEAEAPQHLAIDLEFDQRSALVLLGNLSEARDCLERALSKARALGDRKREGLANCYLTNLYWEMGEQTRAIEAGRAAERLAEQLGDEKIAQMARRYLGRCHLAIGEFATSLELLESCLQESELVTPSTVLVRVFISSNHAEIRADVDGLRFAEETVRLATDLNHPASLGAALAASGRILLRRGELDVAAQHLERSLHIIQSDDIPLLFPFAAGPLGVTYSWLGHHTKGIKLLVDAIDRAAEMGRMVDAAMWQNWLAQSYSLAGEPEKAGEAVEKGLAFSATYGERPSQAWLLRMQGDLELRRRVADFERARHSYIEALEIARELGMRILELRCHVGLANLYAQLGEHDGAGQERMAAQMIGQEMGVDFWFHDPSAPAIPNNIH